MISTIVIWIITLIGLAASCAALVFAILALREAMK